MVMVIMKKLTIMFNDSLFYFIVAIFYNTLKSNLKFCTLTSTKDSYQMPKIQISEIKAGLDVFHINSEVLFKLFIKC